MSRLSAAYENSVKEKTSAHKTSAIVKEDKMMPPPFGRLMHYPYLSRINYIAIT